VGELTLEFFPMLIDSGQVTPLIRSIECSSSEVHSGSCHQKCLALILDRQPVTSLGAAIRLHSELRQHFLDGSESNGTCLRHQFTSGTDLLLSLRNTKRCGRFFTLVYRSKKTIQIQTFWCTVFLHMTNRIPSSLSPD
jgi:hypothetical protein